MKEYRKCPGCGDSGDIDHIAACTSARIALRGPFDGALHRRLWRAGALAVIGMAGKQVIRRGETTLEDLANVVELLAGER